MEKIDELFELLDSDVKRNINKQAFNDIENVFLDIYSHYDSEKPELVSWVCNASPGHGKTQGLISFLKWVTTQESKTPILLAIREKNLVYEILNRVNKFKPNSIISVDSDNKDIVEKDLFKFQIVLIQHSRLENMALGYGNFYDYKKYKGKNRILIIDEKPNFAHSTTFEIGTKNNVLEWFDDLSEGLDGYSSLTTQWIKSFITMLLAEQLYKNESDVTTKLLEEEEVKSDRGTTLLNIIKEMKKMQIIKVNLNH
ncbi:DEAD/DEAH box helicase family protein [Psychrobacillus sp.]|uniref:DEAD/DEAH box helicase family protein n=1 Tax=Psychrobacillus sp. TaxID=1871623 RepID=UPI0028BE0635|nr:DEAD/DEAH box helicase family protein [Psychrobacillus sp.]